MTAQIRKSAKECDCCRKESDPQSCCSALLAFSCACGLQRGPLKAGGHRPARERMLHTVRIIARFRAVTSHLWSAGALYETVSPHLCLAVFCPAVNKASSSCLPTLIHKGRSRSQTESETSELDLPLADNSSRAHWLVTKGSHFWMTGSSVPFQKFTSLIHRSWHGTSLQWNEIGVFLVEQLFFFFFQQTSSADSKLSRFIWLGVGVERRVVIPLFQCSRASHESGRKDTDRGTINLVQLQEANHAELLQGREKDDREEQVHWLLVSPTLAFYNTSEPEHS